MWIENDELLQLTPQIEVGENHYPTMCPICGKSNCHLLLHRFSEELPFGTLWIWCDSCRHYTHASYKIPDWWKNPDFIEHEKLDSLVDYPASLKDDIDAWVNQLVSS